MFFEAFPAGSIA